MFFFLCWERETERSTFFEVQEWTIQCIKKKVWLKFFKNNNFVPSILQLLLGILQGRRWWEKLPLRRSHDRQTACWVPNPESVHCWDWTPPSPIQEDHLFLLSSHHYRSSAVSPPFFSLCTLGWWNGTVDNNNIKRETWPWSISAVMYISIKFSGILGWQHAIERTLQ